MKIPRLVTMLLAGMLLACSMSFVRASDASQAQLAPVDTSPTSSNAEDSIGYSNDGASAELPPVFYDRVNRLACTEHYVELRFYTAQDMEESIYDMSGWITAIINSEEYSGCYRPGFEVFFTAFAGDTTVRVFGRDMSETPDLTSASSSSTASSAPSASSSASSAASSVSSAAPSASSAAPSEEPVTAKPELRRKELSPLYARNGTHPSHAVLPDDGPPQESLTPAAPRDATSSISVSSTRTVTATADLVPTATDLPPMATIDVNHSLENIGFNFPTDPDYNRSNHLSLLCTHCSINGKMSITQGGWHSASDGVAPSLGWLNITLTDFSNALEVRLQGQDSGYMKFPMRPSDTDDDKAAALHVTGLSLPGLGKAGLILKPSIAVGWNFTAPTTVNYCAGRMWQDAPTYVHVDFANLTDAASTFFAYNAFRSDSDDGDARPTPFRGRAMDALHAYGSVLLRMELDLTIVFEEEQNTLPALDPATAGLVSSKAADAAANVRLGWPGVDATFMARPVAEFETQCYNASAGATRAAYALFNDDNLIAANFSADHPTVVVIRKRDTASARAHLGAPVFPWVGADKAQTLREGWVEGHVGKWEAACYVWLERAQRFEEAGYVLAKIKEGMERDAAVAKAAAANGKGELEEDGGGEKKKEGSSESGTTGGGVPSFVVGLVMVVAGLVGFF